MEISLSNKELVEKIDHLWNKIEEFLTKYDQFHSFNCDHSQFTMIALSFKEELPAKMEEAHRCLEADEWEQSDLLMSSEGGFKGYYWKQQIQKVKEKTQALKKEIARYYIAFNREKNLYDVVDRKFPFRIIDDNGEVLYHSGLIGSGFDKAGAERLASEMNLRASWKGGSNG